MCQIPFCPYLPTAWANTFVPNIREFWPAALPKEPCPPRKPCLCQHRSFDPDTATLRRPGHYAVASPVSQHWQKIWGSWSAMKPLNPPGTSGINSVRIWPGCLHLPITVWPVQVDAVRAVFLWCSPGTWLWKKPWGFCNGFKVNLPNDCSQEIIFLVLDGSTFSLLWGRHHLYLSTTASASAGKMSRSDTPV
jgi:hypothetical protein